MDRSIPLLVIGLVFGGGLGFLVAASNGVTLDGHDHATDHTGHAATDMAHHDHSETLDVTGPVPSLSATLVPDPVAGWNLHLEVENFTFAPQNAGGPHVDGEGHAHLYVNDTKIARLYGPWYHIDNLPSGDLSIRIGLYSNDHKALSANGQVLSETVTLNTRP